MDYYGIGLFIIGIVGYFILRNRSRGWATFFAWVWGLGTGIFVGAVWTVMLVNRMFSGFGG